MRHNRSFDTDAQVCTRVSRSNCLGAGQVQRYAY
jgi:hypothetical protein